MMELFRRLVGLPRAASTVADSMDMLHLSVIAVTMAVAAYVFAATAWFLFRYARRRERQLTRHLEASGRHEAVTIGAVLVTFVLWWVVGFRQYLHMQRPPRDAEIVLVSAKQWTWKFSYSDGSESNDVLTVPVGRPIELVMTSRDVIHSFYVPEFRVKSDVVPGRTMTTWFEAVLPGHYPIWCAEYCGVSHSAMLGEVVALAPADYARWKSARADERAAGPRGDCGHGPGSCAGDDLVARGREVAARRACLACHTLDGQRHVGPTWKGLYGAARPLDDGRRVVADAEYLTRSMMEPNVDFVAGYPHVMPSYQGSLSPAEVGALIALIRSLRDGAGDAAADAGVALPPLDVSGSAGARGTP